MIIFRRVCLFMVILLVGCEPSPALYPTSEQVELYRAQGAEFGQKLGMTRKHLLDAVEALTYRINKGGNSQTYFCKASLASGYMMLLQDSIDLLEASAVQIRLDMEICAEKKIWMMGHVAMITFVERQAQNTSSEVRAAIKENITYDDLKKTLLEQVETLDSLLSAWDSLVGHYKSGDARRQMFSGLGANFSEFVKTTDAELDYFDSMVKYYSPVMRNVEKYRGDCGDPIMLYVTNRTVAAKVLTAKQWALMIGLSEANPTLPGTLEITNHGKRYLASCLAVGDFWKKEYPLLAKRYPDPTVEQASNEYAMRYDQWRKALATVIPVDELVMPVKAGLN